MPNLDCSKPYPKPKLGHTHYFAARLASPATRERRQERHARDGGLRVGDPGQHRLQAQARGEHALDDEIVQVPGDTFAILEHRDASLSGLSSRRAHTEGDGVSEPPQQ